MKKLTFLLLIALFSLSSCVTYERCQEKFGQSVDTVRIPININVPYIVNIPADSIQVGMYVDSLLRIKLDSVYRVTNDSSSLVISYWIDKFRRLQIKANQPAKIIHDTIMVHDTISYVPPPIIVKKPTTLESYWAKYKGFAAILLPILIILLIWLKK